MSGTEESLGGTPDGSPYGHIEFAFQATRRLIKERIPDKKEGWSFGLNRVFSNYVLY